MTLSTYRLLLPFLRFLPGEENHFHHIFIQFNAGVRARSKQTKTIAIQRRIDPIGEQYYEGLITATEYLDSLSF